jgi:hypothetical protein
LKVIALDAADPNSSINVESSDCLFHICTYNDTHQMTDSNRNKSNLPPWRIASTNSQLIVSSSSNSSVLHQQRNIHIAPRVSFDRRFAKKPSPWFRIAQWVVPLAATLFGVTFAFIGIARSTQARSIPDPTFAERRSLRFAALSEQHEKQRASETK